MVTIIEILGLNVIGIVGLLIAIYSIFGQKKLEKRMREKEKLKALSVEFKHLIKNIGSIINDIKDPLTNSDIFYQLTLLSQGIISKAFDEKKDIIDIPIMIKIISRKEPEESKGKKEKEHIIAIEKKEEIIKAVEESCIIDIESDIGKIVYDGTLNYDIGGYYIHFTPGLLEKIEILEKEYENLIQEFNPDILKNLKDCIKEMYIVTIDSAIKSRNLKVNVKDFNKADDMCSWVYNEVIGRNKLDPYLIELEKLKGELEKLRENLLTTSYT